MRAKTSGGGRKTLTATGVMGERSPLSGGGGCAAGLRVQAGLPDALRDLLFVLCMPKQADIQRSGMAFIPDDAQATGVEFIPYDALRYPGDTAAGQGPALEHV